MPEQKKQRAPKKKVVETKEELQLELAFLKEEEADYVKDISDLSNENGKFTQLNLNLPTIEQVVRETLEELTDSLMKIRQKKDEIHKNLNK